jgi:two-component system LytT family sensor kinase
MNKLISNRWFQYALPFGIWLLISILSYLHSTSNNVPAEWAEWSHRNMINNIISNFLLLCVFYLHTYVVYPLHRKGTIWYILSLIVLLVLYWFGWSFIRVDFGHIPHHIPVGKPFTKTHGHAGGHGHPDGGGWWGLLSYIIFPPLVAILCSFCYRLILDNRKKQQRLKERETAHLTSELSFLRSQISPHFMFNILNNLVALARKKSDELEPAIVNLSQLMRYMLYESDDHRVILSKEINYLKNYINLQMLRFGSNVKVNIDITGDTDKYTIEPMLLIPFVENAFKHGTGMVEDPVIAISLSIDETTDLMRFVVINEVNPQDESKDSSSGIGTSNVKRRLAILYPGKHELRIHNENNSFTIDLSIYLTH